MNAKFFELWLMLSYVLTAIAIYKIFISKSWKHMLKKPVFLIGLSILVSLQLAPIVF